MRTVKLKDIVPLVKARRPDCPEKVISDIIKYGCKAIVENVYKGKDVSLISLNQHTMLRVYKFDAKRIKHMQQLKAEEKAYKEDFKAYREKTTPLPGSDYKAPDTSFVLNEYKPTHGPDRPSESHG